ncbi:hypothetical protein CLJ_B1621 [Clostridium botulinum Ba4 str. 657]|uniref:Uncharacterized protein n=1 Tax=Clostridium botulinum (strain 657 / Type Ba4) TaxID=515621 RepID=A0A3F3A9Z9_CLOB6|nr:hypothetical protein CLJ_B1621 [Clostridium botulinum Ba4 str. 657]
MLLYSTLLIFKNRETIDNNMIDVTNFYIKKIAKNLPIPF